MMGMYFDITVHMKDILFSGWDTNSWKDVLIAAIIICTMTVIFEGLKVLKSQIIVRRKLNPSNIREDEDSGHGIEVTSSQTNLLQSSPAPLQQTFRNRQILFLVESVLHLLNFFYGYILMLLVMTYSVWFLLAVVVGSGIGFFISHPLGDYLTARYLPPQSRRNASHQQGVSETSRLHQSFRNYQTITNIED